MDNFKNINDSFGHQCGDYLLVALAKRLKTIIPENSIIVRHGGDEFVIFTHLHDNEALLEIAQNIINAISRPYDINTLNLKCWCEYRHRKIPNAWRYPRYASSCSRYCHV